MVWLARETVSALLLRGIDAAYWVMHYGPPYWVHNATNVGHVGQNRSQKRNLPISTGSTGSAPLSPMLLKTRFLEIRFLRLKMFLF